MGPKLQESVRKDLEEMRTDFEAHGSDYVRTIALSISDATAIVGALNFAALHEKDFGHVEKPSSVTIHELMMDLQQISESLVSEPMQVWVTPTIATLMLNGMKLRETLMLFRHSGKRVPLYERLRQAMTEDFAMVPVSREEIALLLSDAVGYTKPIQPEHPMFEALKAGPSLRDTLKTPGPALNQDPHKGPVRPSSNFRFEDDPGEPPITKRQVEELQGLVRAERSEQLLNDALNLLVSMIADREGR